jgi:hypothetical protein
MIKLETCSINNNREVCKISDEVYVDETKITAIEISSSGWGVIKLINHSSITYMVTPDCARNVLRMLEKIEC